MRSDRTLRGHDGAPGNREPNFATNNNRLMWYEEYVDEELVRTVRYTYWKTGDVSNITIKDESSPTDRSDMAFTYTTAGQLWVVVWDTWKVDQYGEISDYEALSAREFRYDTPRARYLSREVDPTYFEPVSLADWEWTDYEGGAGGGVGVSPDEPYADFGVTLNGSNAPIAAETKRYAGGFGTFAQQQITPGNPPTEVTTYLFADLVRSTVMTGDEAGDPTATTAYTAFGEHVSGYSALEGRYAGYCGGWGYESGLLSLAGTNENLPAITLQHVGARWYQPGIGRFVQRDPIGLQGGMNVYVYCQDDPDSDVDPTGQLGGSALVKAAGAVAGAGVAGGLLYHGCLHSGEKGTTKVGKKALLTELVRPKIKARDDPRHRSGLIPVDELSDSSDVEWAGYIRAGDGKVSILYREDGEVHQFYAPNNTLYW